MYATHSYCETCALWLPDAAAWNSHNLFAHEDSAINSEQHILEAGGSTYQSLEAGVNIQLYSI
jgi:hypothetical protein